MIQLFIVSLVAILILGLAFYQEHLDKQKWKRITAPKKPTTKDAAIRTPAESHDGTA
jgi:hypothetical protein